MRACEDIEIGGGSCRNLSIFEFYIILDDIVVRFYFGRVSLRVHRAFLAPIVTALGLGSMRMSAQGKDFGADH